MSEVASKIVTQSQTQNLNEQYQAVIRTQYKLISHQRECPSKHCLVCREVQGGHTTAREAYDQSLHEVYG